MIKQSKLILLFTLLFIFSCMDLNVENINAPDADDALQSPSDVESLIGGAYFTFFNATEYWYPTNGLSVLADELTSSWGNAAMQDLSSEPRVAFNNNSAYIDIDHLNVPWNLYSAITEFIGSINIIIKRDAVINIIFKLYFNLFNFIRINKKKKYTKYKKITVDKDLINTAINASVTKLEIKR